MTLPEPFPEDLVLQPESRWPLKLPEETLARVLQRPLPAGPEDDMRSSAQADGPAVSIVVVTYNNLVFNRLCLESVLAHTDSASYEIRVVDNCSEDGTAAYLSELARAWPQVHVELNEHNAGFAVAANQGLKAATGNTLLLLNNDTIVPPGWLPLLLRGLDEPGVGMVGPVSNRCGNEAQIDVRYSNWGEYLQCAGERARLHSGETRDIRMLTMFCVALKREVFERIGALDERFAVGLFEDEDYSMRLRNAGYSLHCLEDVLVHHFGQASIGKLAEGGAYGSLFRSNRRRFEKKWDVTWRPHGRRPNVRYRELLTRVRRYIESSLPQDSTVLVVSKGDEDLLTVSGHTARHFPQDQRGQYAGFYPENSRSAIEHLEHLIVQGAHFLLIPETMFWWLQYYSGFAEHLAKNYECIQHDEACLVYRLRDLKAIDPDDAAGSVEFSRGVERLDRRLVTLVVAVSGGFEDFECRLKPVLDAGRLPRQWLFMVDHGADRRIEALLERLAAEQPHAAYVVMNECEGPVAVLNFSLKLAPGDVVLMNSQGTLSTGWLEHMSALAYGREAVATVSGLADQTLGATPSSLLPAPLLITRAAIRKVGLLDNKRFPYPSAAVEDFTQRACAENFVHLADEGIPGPSHDSAATADTPERDLSWRPGLLALVHSGSGGARMACEDLLATLSGSFRCLMLSAGRSHWALHEFTQGESMMRRRYAFPGDWKLDSLPADRRHVLEDICENFAVDLVNIHHLLGSGPEVIDFFAKRRIPVIFSFHDFYPLCPTAHLIDDRQDFCAGVCTEGQGDCSLSREYFRAGFPQLKHRYVHTHRTRMQEALSRCSAFTAPSFTVAKRLNQFPGFAALPDFQVIPHAGINTKRRLAQAPEDGKPVRVLCLGNLNAAKGLAMIRELLVLNDENDGPFEFHFLGAGQRRFRAEESGGICHGPYKRQELQSRIEEIGPSFTLLASICEETWSLTLSESWQAGIPVFASDRGALKERIESGGGWLFEAGDARAFYRGMVKVLQTPDAWSQAVAAICQIQAISAEQEAARYERLYRRILAQREPVRVTE